MEYLKYLGSLAINFARYTGEIKYSAAMSKEAFNKTKTLFACKLDFRKETSTVLNLKHCYVAMCGAETGILRAVDQKLL